MLRPSRQCRHPARCASAYRPWQVFLPPITVLTLARSRTSRFLSYPPHASLTIALTYIRYYRDEHDLIVPRPPTHWHNLDVDAERGPPLEPGRTPPRAFCPVAPGEFLSALHQPRSEHATAG